MKRIVFSLFLIFGVIFNCPAIRYSVSQKDSLSEKPNQITWFEFDWLPNPYYYNLNVEKAHILVDVRFENLQAPYPFYFRMMATENSMYNRTKDAMIWHFPGFEKLLVQRQSAGRTVIEHFPELIIRLGDSKITYGGAHFKVIPDPIASIYNEHASKVGGILSYELFKNKVLYIDFPNQRIGYSDIIPEGYLNRGLFTKLQLTMGYITIPVRINNKKYWFWLSGDTTPALEIYNERLFNRIRSNHIINDSLLVFNDLNKPELVSGFFASVDPYFEAFKLKKQNVYFVERKKTRFQGKKISGTISNAFFFDYTMVIDYKNQRFGLVPK
jgi:hypothetical protein